MSVEEASQWCNYHGGLPYFETSAKDDVNIGEVFKAAVQLWLNREAVMDARMRSEANTLYLNQQHDRTRERERECC